MMRTFVALNLPAEERKRIHEALAPLRERDLPVRWARPESLHITLKFLGDTEAGGVPDIDRVLMAAAARRAPFRLRIAGVGAFPTLRRASIIWVGATADAELAALQRELEPALSRLGYPREHKPFRPHITVGRLRADARPLDVERLVGSVRYESELVIETVELMQSHMGAGGSRYEALLSRRLGEKVET